MKVLITNKFCFDKSSFLVIVFFVLFDFSYSQNIDSDLNSVFIEDDLIRIDVTMNQTSLDSLLNSNVYNTPDLLYHSSIEVTISNQVYSLNDVGIRLRGNTSLTAPKKSFKLDFNAFIPGQK